MCLLGRKTRFTGCLRLDKDSIVILADDGAYIKSINNDTSYSQIFGKSDDVSLSDIQLSGDTIRITGTNCFAGNCSFYIYENIGRTKNWGKTIEKYNKQCFGDTCYCSQRDTQLTPNGDFQIAEIMKRSNDGGKTWEEIAGAPGSTKAIISSYWLSPRICWVVMTYQRNTIYKTDDYGNSWVNVRIEDFNEMGTITFLKFYSTTFAALVLSQQLFIMRDGFHFHKIPTPPINAITFLDTSNGYIAAESCLYRTKNGGITWDSIGFKDEIKNTYDKYILSRNNMYYHNAAVGWLWGKQGCLMSTTDSGTTWKSHSAFIGEGNNVGLTFIDDSTGYIATSGKFLTTKTTTAGQTWNTVQSSSPVHTNPVTIARDSSWYIGNLRSFDRGKSWDTIHIPVTFSALYPVSHNIIYGASGYTVYKSNDAGLTWSSKALPTYEQLISFDFIDSLNGFVLGKSGTVFKTTDGETWSKINDNTIFAVTVFSKDNIYRPEHRIDPQQIL